MPSTDVCIANTVSRIKCLEIENRGGQIVNAKPLRVFDFTGLGHDVAAGPSGRERNHQAVGKGLALAAEVAQLVHLHGHFFGYFAAHTVFNGLTGFNKTGQGAPDFRAIWLKCSTHSL